jgi:hypothetical protein
LKKKLFRFVNFVNEQIIKLSNGDEQDEQTKQTKSLFIDTKKEKNVLFIGKYS